MNHTIFDRAEKFIYNNARLLERQLFAYHFKGWFAGAGTYRASCLSK